MFKWLLLFFVPLNLFAFDLQQELKKAEAGDYIVYAYKQSLLLMRIAQVGEHRLVVEEISAPLRTVSENWQEWLNYNAPSHTSWTISTIDTASGKVESIFSVDEKKFVNSNPALQFLPTLVKLKLIPIDPAERKKIGPEPLPGEIDLRRLWLPKIVFEGKILHPNVLAFKVFWPKDESELAGKALDLYFAEKQALPYLPYWIEVAGGVTKAKIGAIDSGHKLASPVSSLVSMTTYEQPKPSGCG